MTMTQKATIIAFLCRQQKTGIRNTEPEKRERGGAAQTEPRKSRTTPSKMCAVVVQICNGTSFSRIRRSREVGTDNPRICLTDSSMVRMALKSACLAASPQSIRNASIASDKSRKSAKTAGSPKSCTLRVKCRKEPCSEQGMKSGVTRRTGRNGIGHIQHLQLKTKDQIAFRSLPGLGELVHHPKMLKMIRKDDSDVGILMRRTRYLLRLYDTKCYDRRILCRRLKTAYQ